MESHDHQEPYETVAEKLAADGMDVMQGGCTRPDAPTTEGQRYHYLLPDATVVSFDTRPQALNFLKTINTDGVTCIRGRKIEIVQAPTLSN